MTAAPKCDVCGRPATQRYWDKLGWAYFCDAHADATDEPIPASDPTAYPGAGTCACTGDEPVACVDPECINTYVPHPSGFDPRGAMRRFVATVARGPMIDTWAREALGPPHAPQLDPEEP